MKNQPKVITIVGPNASGKSALAVRLAKKFNGEIISADSRQVYKGLDIGTGKISRKEMAGVRHYLLDVANPRRQFSVAHYQKLAEPILKNILGRRKLPIICGGTGFYIQAVVNGLKLPAVPPDQKLRRRLQKFNDRQLFSLLQNLDSGRAATIDRHNRRRLVRAIEIAQALGRVPRPRRGKPPYEFLQIGVCPPLPELKKRIRRRLLSRLRQGMIAEVKKLHRGGLSWKRLDDLGLEYRFVSVFLRKQPRNFLAASEPVSRRVKREEIAGLLKQLETAIWHYAKRQLTWFKKDKEIKWIKNYRQAERLVSDFL